MLYAEEELSDLIFVQLRAELLHHHFDVRLVGFCHADCCEFFSQISRKGLLAGICGGVHASNDSEVFVSFDVIEISLFVEE